MILSPELNARFEAVDAAVTNACLDAGISRDTVTIVGVIKKQPPEAVQGFIEWCRSRALPAVVGVNYVQEYRDLVPHLPTLPDKAHCIGRLQKNKAKDAVKLFDVIESVDSPELAGVLDAAAERAGKIQEIFLQVNISGDERKGGFDPLTVRRFLREEVGLLKHLSVTGFMTITRFYDTAEEARPDFRKLAELRREIPEAANFKLSMGMSQDFPVAIAEGANLIRIGTALFGERKSE